MNRRLCGGISGACDLSLVFHVTSCFGLRLILLLNRPTDSQKAIVQLVELVAYAMFACITHLLCMRNIKIGFELQPCRYGCHAELHTTPVSSLAKSSVNLSAIGSANSLGVFPLGGIRNEFHS